MIFLRPYAQMRLAYTIFNGNNYTIAYNDTKYADRIWFTLMHEIGHIYLNHFKDFEKTIIRRNELSKGEYKILENEANAFARNVLSPAPVVEQLKEKSTDKLCIYFHLSKDAASTRLDFLHSDMYWNNYTKVTFKILSRFLNYFNVKHCSICNNSSPSKADFCSICGSASFKWGEGKMKYSKMETYDNGKVKICPVCENEETNIDGDFCQICNTLLINKCDDRDSDNHADGWQPCGQTLPANARYCPKCGVRSTFLNDKILKPWDWKEPSFPVGNGFINIPDSYDLPDGVEDEGLPFN